MGVLTADDSKLISGGVTGKLRAFGHFGLLGQNIFCADNTEAMPKSDFVIDTLKITGTEGSEEVKVKTEMKRKVIFYHFGFFTIRVLPRSGHTSLLRLFF